MAPRKEPLSPERLRDLLEQYNIIFRGPTLTKSWPPQHKHLFQHIRKIGTTLYEDYIDSIDIEPQIVEKQRSRATDLRNQAHKLLQDINTNEGTWRDAVEKSVFERFDKDVLCDRCGNENFESDHLAYPFDEKEKAVLEKNRQGRKRCNGSHDNNVHKDEREESDDESLRMTFNSELCHEVSHHPDDHLEGSGIPMRPDRVVGLRKTAKYKEYISSCPPYLTHYPIKQKDILYPFLVVEAKKESNTPGFKSIERQTAFPVRRFLKIQDDLRNARRTSCLDHLVWFFAYQGENWRLYAGTYKDSKVSVYQLWHDTIESYDGALRLILIVDFIWTWARDVYRPQLRRCLRGYAGPREPSPTSTNRLTRSPSIHSLSSFMDTVRANRESDSTCGSSAHFRDRSTHPFLSWANSRDSFPSCQGQAIIRHSDIVAFSFRVLVMPEIHDDFQRLMQSLQYTEEELRVMSHLLELTHGSQYSFPLSKIYTRELAEDWTAPEISSSQRPSATHSDRPEKAFFSFRTFCQKEDWQIKREINCIIWSPQAVELLNSHRATDIGDAGDQGVVRSMQPSQISRTFPQLRHLFGKHSIMYALYNTSLVLSHGTRPYGDESELRWAPPSAPGIDEAAVVQFCRLFDAASHDSVMSQRNCFQRIRLLQLRRSGQAVEIPSSFPLVPKNIGEEGAILAKRCDSWPPQCPRFCLFVLLEDDFDDKARLRHLLRYAVRKRQIYGEAKDMVHEQTQFQSTNADAEKEFDRTILKTWVEAFDVDPMEIGDG